MIDPYFWFSSIPSRHVFIIIDIILQCINFTKFWFVLPSVEKRKLFEILRNRSNSKPGIRSLFSRFIIWKEHIIFKTFISCLMFCFIQNFYCNCCIFPFSFDFKIFWRASYIYFFEICHVLYICIKDNCKWWINVCSKIEESLHG